MSVVSSMVGLHFLLSPTAQLSPLEVPLLTLPLQPREPWFLILRPVLVVAVVALVWCRTGAVGSAVGRHLDHGRS